MRRHCEQQHPDHQLPDERAAQCDRGAEELIVVGEGERAFWDNKRKSRWTQPERKQKRKKMRTALRDALQGDKGGGKGGPSLRRPGHGLRRTNARPRRLLRGDQTRVGGT